MINKLIIKPLLCFAAGIACIVIGVTIMSSSSDFLETQAVITSIDSYYSGGDQHYSVMVEYKVDGTFYNEELGAYASSYKVGKEIAIKYNPDNPRDITDASGLGQILFISLGILCLLCGVGQILRTLRRG